MSMPYQLRYHLGAGRKRGPSAASTDHFLYRAAAGGRPPSLSLLPDCNIKMHDHEGQGGPYAPRVFDVMDTGILRCGGDEDDDREVLVAQLQVAHKAPFDSAEICLLRPGRRCWELKAAVPIVHSEGGGRYDLRSWLELHGAIPAGNRFLCWVNYDRSTLLVCDMAEENPKLRYMPLPIPVKAAQDVHPWQYYRSIGASTTSTAVPVVRFVSIDPAAGAFVVSTWTMALNTTGQPLEWVKEGVLGCEEIWVELRAAGYHDIARLDVNCPIVSSENPDVICFIAQDIDSETNGNKRSWTLEFDMRSKKLTSVVSPCNGNAHPIQWDLCVNYGKPLC